MLEWLREIAEVEWKPVGRAATIGWLVFYAVFLLYAFSASGQFLLIDNVNLVVHEGGHLLFSWLGSTMTLWGGTLLQWLVPFLLAAYFWTQRQTTAYVFSLFFFFENWIYTAAYMADARAQVLPLVGVGDMESEESMHDFYRIFTQLGVLDHDTQIAAAVRILGWVGMIGCVAWLGWRGLRAQDQAKGASNFG
jgi:hypothetical protein